MWEEYADRFFSRFFALWRSTSQSMRWRHLRRARKYVITGRASSSKAEEWETLAKAFFSSPEMLAVLIAVVTALGSACLCLLQLPFLLTEPKEGEMSPSIVEAMRKLLGPDDSGLRFILTSVGLLLVYAFIVSAVTQLELKRIATAKNPLIVKTCRLDALYYYEMEERDTEWYTVANRMVPMIVRTVLRFLDSPPMLTVYAVMSAFYLSGLSGVQLLLAGTALLASLFVGWEHYWSGITCDCSPDGTSNGEGALLLQLWKVRRAFAGLWGLRLGRVLMLFLITVAWCEFAHHHVLVAKALAFDPSIGTHLYSVLAAYALYQVLWRFAARVPLGRVKHLLGLEEKLRRNPWLDLRVAGLEHHSFSVWCKRLVWMKASSFVRQLCWFEVMLWVLCYLGR